MDQPQGIDDLELEGKRVLIRVDFNVPLDENANILDDLRIQASLPTIQEALKKGASVILMSHLGRPKGKKNAKFSLQPCQKRLSELLNQPVEFVSECVGEEVRKKAKNLSPGDVLLLENLRFHEAETNPDSDPNFAKQLAELGEAYVNDAFGTAHRKHSSTYTIISHFPGKAAAGKLMLNELEVLGKYLMKPKRPYTAMIGGAKISSKLKLLDSLLSKVDHLLIGGAMAYTFFAAKGIAIGKSLFEEEYIEDAKKLIEKAQANKIDMRLPSDLLIAKEIKKGAKTKNVDASKGIPDGWEGVSIGPKTVSIFEEVIQSSQTIFWNGPLGIFEIPEFAKGTTEIAQSVARLSGVITVVGGGDSVSAIRQLDLSDQVTHLSTGGGASLKYLETGSLPVVQALIQSKQNVGV